ncbi:MAG: hypothetical protein PHN62_13705 [Neomegalonema sp.]|nr:hypothetical protein [Neomegalonema sp.]
MLLTESDIERRRRMSFVVEELARIFNYPSMTCYGLAGRMMKKYPYQFIVQVLGQIQPGSPLPYVMGALRNSAFKAGMFQNQEVTDLASRMKI